MSTSLTLSSRELEIDIDRPGASGTYCGARFSWAGIIRQVRGLGHLFFGPWRAGTFPLNEHDHVTGTAGEFGMGCAGMPPPLGFEEAPANGRFVKIGVGVLRRPDDAPYSFSRRYDLVATPPWQVKQTGQAVEMRQVLAHEGYGYDYGYRLELAQGDAAFITRHTLLNTGRNPICQTHYSHNFIVIDRQPIGPAYEVTFPFTPESSLGPESLAHLEGTALRFRAPIPAGKAVFTQLSGFGSTSADNQVTVRHREAGVEVRIAGDRPVERYHFFAAPGAVCPEPFVGLHLAPGESATWSHRYGLACRA